MPRQGDFRAVNIHGGAGGNGGRGGEQGGGGGAGEGPAVNFGLHVVNNHIMIQHNYGPVRNMNTVSNHNSYTIDDPSSRNTDRGGFTPNRYQAPLNPQYGDPNARFPGYRQPAPNLDRSITEPTMNTPYNPQNRRYPVGNVPGFDADAALAAYVQRRPNERPIAPPLQSAYSAPPQAYPRDRRGPAQPRPASMAVMPVSSQNNSGGMSYLRNNLDSSPEDAVPSSWSSRRMSMGEFPPEENWSPQTPPNRNQFPPSSYQVRPQAPRRREEVRDDSGSDWEDPDPTLSAPPWQPQPRRTTSQVISSSSAQPPRRPQQYYDPDDDSGSDSDGAAVVSPGLSSQTRQNSSQQPGISTRVQQPPPMNQAPPPSSRPAHPQTYTSSRPPPISNQQYPPEAA